MAPKASKRHAWFSLPPTNPDPADMLEDSASLDPDWLLNRNFKNRLHFVPWTSFRKEVVKVEKQLSRLGRTNVARTAIDNLFEPVREELNQKGWTGCWNESAVDHQIAAQVWRAIKKARKAILSIRKLDDTLPELSMVPQKDVRSERYASRVAKDLGRTVSISNPEHIVPDYCLFAQALDSKKDMSPLATVELKGSLAGIVHDHGRGYSSKEVAKNCQRTFDTRPVKEYLGKDFSVTKRLSQALTQAFHTESGSGVLYNHVYAVFFYIEGKEVLRNGKTRITVQISEVYRCDVRLSNLHAFTAWFFLVEELVDLGRISVERKTKLLESIEFVSTSSREHEDDDDSPPSASSAEPSSLPSTPTGASSSDTSSPAKKRQKSGENRKSSKKKSDSGSGSKKRTYKEDEKPISRAVEVLRKRMASFQSFLASCGIADVEKQVEAFRNDDLVTSVLESPIDLLGEGAFGFVRKASLNGITVAVKYCNRSTGDAQHYLHNEIAMNCHIASSFPHLMRKPVPRLVAVGFDEWAGPVLITEMVGNGVHIEEGQLSIGREQLHPNMIWMVCYAALECLRSLHNCGILHRDVTLRNLRARVRRGEEEDCLNVNDFEAWWIDLGFSKVGSAPEDFEFELKQCLSLFPSVSPSDIQVTG